MAKLIAFDRGQVEFKAGTILSREWNGARTQTHQTCHHRKPSLAAPTAGRLNSNP